MARGMLGLLVAVALAPWSHPLRFGPLAGWSTGAGGTFASSYGRVPHVAAPRESTAWIARGVRYVDGRAADPPNATLSRLPPHGIVVFAVIFQSGQTGERPVELRLGRATHFDCCDGTYVEGGMDGLAGSGPGAAYSVIVRVYYGTRPTRSMRTAAQRALDRLELPAPR